MFEDNEFKKLREDWPKMSYEDKVDKFLWNMVWFHHEKHIPGNSNQAIKDLTKTLENTSSASEKLTRSISTATWVAGIAAIFGILLGVLSLIQQIRPQEMQVKQKIFEECFDYYAMADRETGIAKTTVQTCKEKAEQWGK